jgi:hypothetical protein
MTNTTSTAILTGDTYMIRSVLAAKGWRFDAARKAYTKTTDWVDAAEVVAVVRGYAGVRNRGTLRAELVEVAS